MNLVEMVIESPHMPLMGYRKRLALSEKNGSRTLAIWINQLDAEAISAGLKNVKSSRTHTYDFIYAIICGLGANLERIVYDIGDVGLRAAVVIKRDKDAFQIECTPADAISIALKAGVPIFATEDLLTKMGT